MAGKRNEMELADDRARIAELMRRGTVNPSQLADIINEGRPKNKQVSRQTISKDIEWLKEQYKESAMYDFNEAWHETLAQYNDLLKVTWAEFYDSRKVKLTITEDKNQTEVEDFNDSMQDGSDLSVSVEDVLSDARSMKTIIKKEQREGNVAYLQLIEKIIEKIAKMKGVDGTSKIAFTDSKGADLPSVTDGILATLKKISSPVDDEFLEGELVEQELLLEGGHDEDT
jgi:hypothetical protein